MTKDRQIHRLNYQANMTSLQALYKAPLKSQAVFFEKFDSFLVKYPNLINQFMQKINNIELFFTCDTDNFILLSFSKCRLSSSCEPV